MTEQHQFQFVPPDGTIQARFLAYHSKHPDVYAMLCEYVDKLKCNGHNHYSVDAIIHVIRFHRAITAPDDEQFRICNDYTSRYARMYRDDRPDDADFFTLRKLKSQ